MAAKGSTFDNDLLKLIFNATSIANIAIDATSSPLTSLYVALHTASPLAGGSQTTNEAAYSGYSRVAVTRNSGGWTVTSNSVSPTANILFSEAVSGTETLTHFSVGTASSGAGKILYFGEISPSINITTGVSPQLTTATTITES